MPYKNPAQQKAAQRQHYENNKSKYKTASLASRAQREDLIRKAKDGPCKDCGCSYPPHVMHFDHTEDNKVANVSWLVRNAGIDRVREEIAKCELVCANCHADRTWRRLQIVPDTIMCN